VSGWTTITENQNLFFMRRKAPYSVQSISSQSNATGCQRNADEQYAAADSPGTSPANLAAQSNFLNCKSGLKSYCCQIRADNAKSLSPTDRDSLVEKGLGRRSKACKPNVSVPALRRPRCLTARPTSS
jgi:hypothetical protein